MKTTLGLDTMAGQRGRRGDPNFTQITALVPKSLGLEFKADCTRNEVSISEAIEQLIQERQSQKGNAVTAPPSADSGRSLISLIGRLWQKEDVQDSELSEVAYDCDLPIEALHQIKECLSRRNGSNAHLHKI